MKKYITILLFTFILGISAFAQTEDKKEDSNCPDISIDGPPSSYSPGELMTFTVKLSEDYDDDKVIITWSVDKGTIIKGQGTKTITVSTVGLNDETMTATVNVVVGSCNLSASETGITGCTVNSIQIDEFGNINEEDFLARTDAFIADLQNNPGSQGYIVNYGPKKNIVNREKMFRKHLNFRGYDIENIVFVNGGKEKVIRTRFWRVPAGADASEID